MPRKPACAKRPRPGLFIQLVDALNLRKVFEGEASRELLRQAGFRGEKHLVTFLALRVIVPLIVGMITFVYASTIFADRFSPSMRVALAMGGLILGFYLPQVGIKNLIQRRQALDQEGLVGCPRSSAHLRGIGHGARGHRSPA